jgi:oxygen-independent coproporphyrinogen-3 oxidase
MVKAIAKEIDAEKGYFDGEPIHTVYFGGGTPSLLTETDIQLLLSSIHKNHYLSSEAEITLEANPDDISHGKLENWRSAGINRLSIGVQSFFEEELKWMNRAHNAKQAIESLQLAVQSFDNITIDLIYGSPLLSDEMWRENVDKATALGIKHLSCYALTVEEKTPLHKLIQATTVSDVDNDKQARQFLLLMQWLREKGYEHYEVSNFAMPGYRSRHNSSYWKGEKYLGVGPSAHSYNGRERRWNIANNQLYISGTNESVPKRETEILTPTQQLNEYIMISLRTGEGMKLDDIAIKWGITAKDRLMIQLQKFVASGLVNFKNGNVRLTDEGMLRADGIASDLFASF